MRNCNRNQDKEAFFTGALGAEAVAARKLKPTACYQCPVGCEAIMKAGTGAYKYGSGSHRPEYETLAMLGSNCLNTNIESIIKVNDICNRYGLDTISAGAAAPVKKKLSALGLEDVAEQLGLLK